MSSPLLIRPHAAASDGTALLVTPESAAWGYVGFELLQLSPGVSAERHTVAREVCVVVIAGTVDIASEHGDWRHIGGRPQPFAGLPHAVYLGPQTSFTLSTTTGAEVGLCFAPATHGTAARVIPADAITPETRGYGDMKRVIHPILMGQGDAESLLVAEVQTPAGHWSSYPPHRHDRDTLPDESYLEETYYHRVDPGNGFVVQRIYDDDRTLDETLTVCDGQVVLVPRGYHPVGVPPGYRSYYLNVMAGPTRTWAFHNDPVHDWLMTPPMLHTEGSH